MRLRPATCLAAAAALAGLTALAGPSQAAVPAGGTVLAVVGDAPYGVDQPVGAPGFPRLVSAINADPDVTMAVHLGDIKNGSTMCSDAYFNHVKGLFDTFADPLVYTPGDNEWTDCHRANNGAFVPTERLDKLRATFFPTPGQTLGGARTVIPQGGIYKENVRWVDSGVVFATLDIPGSLNDQAPWFPPPQTFPVGTTPADQTAEFTNRTAAVLTWIDEAFDAAAAISAPGVVLSFQADMWNTGVAMPTPMGPSYDSIIQRIGDRSAAFAKPVLLLNGDTHRYYEDAPLTAGSPGKAVTPGVTAVAPNVKRITVEGEQTNEWLKLTVDPASPTVFSWARTNVAAIPAPVVPEAPAAALLALAAVGVLAVVVRRRAAL